MQLAQLAALSRQLAATSRRLEKIEALAAALVELGSDEAECAVAWLCGELRQGKIGLGMAALRELRGIEPAPEASLPLTEVDRCFEEIASTRGAGSVARRSERLAALMHAATAAEQDFLARLVLGELRQGALEGVLLDAIARAVEVPAQRVRRAHMLGGDLREVGAALLREGEAALDRFRLQLFRPLQPMLAGSAEDLETAMGDLGEAAIETKLDGARIQVHRQGDEVRVYTRQLNEVTAAVPEVVEATRALPDEALILDGEVIALRPDGRPRPFQVSMRRFGRKQDDADLRAEIPLTPFFFDCLHRGGEDLLDETARERMEQLAEAVPEARRVPRCVTADLDEARAFHQRTLAQGHEGVVAKKLSAPYEAGRRGKAWIKLKQARSLDLVVLAVDWGSGRRQGRLSNIHLGARDAAGRWMEVGKTFKGMSDEILRWQTEHFARLKVGEDRGTVHLRPEVVAEIAFDGIQASRQYPGGLALRFARLVGYRPDKTIDTADPFERVRALYEELGGGD